MQNFTNEETGQYFYEPVKLNLYSVIRRFSAWKRIIIWGFCPACNSDAPKLYDCKCCNYSTGSPFKRAKRKQLWNKWKYLDFINAL